MKSTTLAVLLIALAFVGIPALHPSAASGGNTLHVGATETYHTIQAAVNAAQPGDSVLVDAGTYQEEVTITTPDITLAGVDRDTVVLEGSGFLGNGVSVTANGVAIHTMTARDYTSNGFQFSGVDGFAMTDLHAIDNSQYGLYAIHSVNGDISHSVGTGHADSAFYIGETYHCNCDVHDNVGYHNMLGYSGTANSYVRIWNNEFYDNRAGILMSVLPSEMGIDSSNHFEGTQVHTSIYNNNIHDNNCQCPTSGIFSTLHPPIGEGITIAGGWMNDIHDNTITENHYCGVCEFWLSTPERGNAVHDNTITGGRYGIWWDEWGEDNCFEHNAISNVQTTSDPAQLPSCAPLVPGAPQGCPDALTDWAACRASDVRAPSAAKDANLALRSYDDLQPDQDPLP